MLINRKAKPDVLLRGVIRADKIIDQLCKETIEKECEVQKRANLKHSYVIKGHGKGKGTQFSHPRMDFLCLNNR